MEQTFFNEKLLLAAMSEGDEKAFSRLFHTYRDKLYSFIFILSASSQLAEDTVQEIFLKIWQKRGDAKGIREFDSYIFRMAHNHAVTTLKRKAKETFILQEMDQLATDSIELATAIENKEAHSAVRRAIDNLPDKQKQVFLLSRDYGLKQAEISRILNITVPTVKSHITQAMHSIKKQCKDLYPVFKIVLVLFFSYPR